MEDISRIVDGLGISGICARDSARPNTDEPTWGDIDPNEGKVQQSEKAENTTNPQLVGKTQKELTLILKAVRENAADHPGLTEEAVKAAITEALRKNKAAKAEAASAAPVAPAPSPAPAKVKLTWAQMADRDCRNGEACPNKDKKGREQCAFRHSKKPAAPPAAPPAAAPAAAPAAPSEKVKAILKVAGTLDLEQLTSLLRAITELADLAALGALAGPHA
jgi:hypothetical protein